MGAEQPFRERQREEESSVEPREGEHGRLEGERMQKRNPREESRLRSLARGVREELSWNCRKLSLVLLVLFVTGSLGQTRSTMPQQIPTRADSRNLMWNGVPPQQGAQHEQQQSTWCVLGGSWENAAWMTGESVAKVEADKSRRRRAETQRAD
ncbi:hypothetical protein N7532_003865 [Penicillium argentinense]|uniref:Uncharacterized protein n=1 Tax=Penicillium argentinense TaxID=1131581 RepID=A0A9W9KEX5_9EURO|nr:uncharacterized protein N7532_003865 [Penicillium argentinense]KAJ5103336.1 hypothetical protein N7532_003865 [Penicillium argentinense]